MKTVLETPNLNGKHARSWTKVFGSRVESVHIVYRAGKENTKADALSRNPVSLSPKEDLDSGAQVTVVDSTDTTIEELLALLLTHLLKQNFRKSLDMLEQVIGSACS